MARSIITKPTTLARLSAKIGRPVVVAMARGNTDHRIDCCLADRTIVHLYRDGTTADAPYKVAEHVMPKIKVQH